jgi:hypothetical protein
VSPAEVAIPRGAGRNAAPAPVLLPLLVVSCLSARAFQLGLFSVHRGGLVSEPYPRRSRRTSQGFELGELARGHRRSPRRVGAAEGFAEHCSSGQSIDVEQSVCSGLSAQGKNLPRTAVYPNLLWCSKFKAPIPGNLGGQGGRCTAQITSYPPLFHRRPTTDYLFRKTGHLRTGQHRPHCFPGHSLSLADLWQDQPPQTPAASRGAAPLIHRLLIHSSRPERAQGSAGPTSTAALGS